MWRALSRQLVFKNICLMNEWWTHYLHSFVLIFILKWNFFKRCWFTKFSYDIFSLMITFFYSFVCFHYHISWFIASITYMPYQITKLNFKIPSRQHTPTTGSFSPRCHNGHLNEDVRIHTVNTVFLMLYFCFTLNLALLPFGERVT